MTIEEIKKEAQNKFSALFEECGVFFAFSNEQFEENKTPLQEGEKYVSMGAGGYMPKSKVEDYLNGSAEITKWEKSEIKKEKDGVEKHILHELYNHECFYVNSIEDVLWLPYPRKKIMDVFNKNKAAYWELNG